MKNEWELLQRVYECGDVTLVLEATDSGFTLWVNDMGARHWLIDASMLVRDKKFRLSKRKGLIGKWIWQLTDKGKGHNEFSIVKNETNELKHIADKL